MTKFCKKCDKEFEKKQKLCPQCKGKLIIKYTEDELEEIKKQNDDFTVINTIIF